MPNAPYYQEGKYACKIVSQALGETGTGKPQFAIRFTVMGLVDAADPTRFIPAAQQYERTHYRTITDKTITYFIEDLKTLGFYGTSFRELDPNGDDFYSFAGLDVDMKCSHKPAQEGGGIREEWGIARKGGGELEIKPLESKKVRELDNLFGKHLKGLKANTASAPTPAQPKPQAESAGMEITDDDIPF